MFTLASSNRDSRPGPPAARPKAPGGPANALWSRFARGDRPLQAKLRVGAVDDPFEREADQVAEAVVSGSAAPAVQRKCAACEEEEMHRSPAELPVEDEEEKLQTKRSAAATPEVSPKTASRIASFRGGGEALSPAARSYFEPRFGRDLSAVRLHTGGDAATAAREIQARAFTVGSDIAFGSGEYRPESPEGRRLLAHELTHTVQQGTSRERIQRDQAPGVSPQPAAEPGLSGPLTDEEWQQLTLWQSRGEVGIDPLTGDPEHNALLVASAIFCGRFLGADDRGEAPLLCVLPEVTVADPRVRQLVRHVNARGPIINWTRVDENQRILIVMRLLVSQHGFPADGHGAAGLVGNLIAESHVLPNKIERAGARIPGATPLTDRDFTRRVTHFTAEQVMNRDAARQQGPRKPGIGLAQWTGSRRAGLFRHVFQGQRLGPAILFNMDAQVDHLISELRTPFFRGVDRVLRRPGVSVEEASDEVVYRFEAPGEILDSAGHLRPRTDPAVQRVFTRRRRMSQRALEIFEAQGRGERASSAGPSPAAEGGAP